LERLSDVKFIIKLDGRTNIFNPPGADGQEDREILFNPLLRIAALLLLCFPSTKISKSRELLVFGKDCLKLP